MTHVTGEAAMATIPNDKGRLIIFEGGEGAGKSTLARNLYIALTNEGVSVILTREPGGSPHAEEIRRLIVERAPEENFCAETQLLLHYAARMQHLSDLVIPALQAGKIVLCDRFEGSSYAYQIKAHGGDRALFLRLHEAVTLRLQPEQFDCCYVHCDIEPELGVTRTKVRGGGVDVHDGAALEFHHQVRAGMRELGEVLHEAYKHYEIDASQSPEAMLKQTRALLGL